MSVEQAAGPTEDRAFIQRRTLQVLFASSAVARVAQMIGFAVAVLVIEDLLGSSRWAGLSTVSITVGTVISAGALSAYMNRRGRRPGLVLGYGIAMVGGATAMLGAQLGSLTLFLLGLMLAGIGAGANNLARYAAADLAEPDAKAKAISFIVFASALGAVGGPALVGVADDVGQSLGLNENVGPHGVTMIFFAIAAVVVLVTLRPDPLVVSGGLSSASGGRRDGMVDAFRVISRSPLARLALLSLVVSQAVMVGVMAMTPLHMRAHDHDIGTIGLVISAHTAGMFAFAPLAGWVSDRFGRVRAIAVGAATLAVATAVTALAGEAPAALMFPGLYLLGLGWSFGMVAGSALLTEAVPDADRVGVQGAADLLAGVVSGGAALASGLVLDMAGFHVLSMIGIVGSGALLVVGYARDRMTTLIAN
ncbi:MAG: MFS transporter [Ilumatobacter sp.]